MEADGDAAGRPRAPGGGAVGGYEDAAVALLVSPGGAGKDKQANYREQKRFFHGIRSLEKEFFLLLQVLLLLSSYFGGISGPLALSAMSIHCRNPALDVM